MQKRAYRLMVRLHDVYGMHEIFEPGFPGLLEAFYVQERLMNWLIPDVYQSFVRITFIFPPCTSLCPFIN